MKKTTILMVTLLAITVMSCEQRIDGSSEENFKKSREKVEQSLNEAEKENLEKAFRVITIKAMKERWNSTSKTESSNQISLRIVDRKTYKQLVRAAEEFLKKENEEKKEKIKAELQELEILKANYDKSKRTVKLLNAIIEKGTFIETEVLKIVFDYRFEQAGGQAVTYLTKNIETGDMIGKTISISENISAGEETFNQSVILSKSRLLEGNLSEEQVQNLFNAEFPILQKDFSKYGIDFQIYSIKSGQTEKLDMIDEKSYVEAKENLQSELQELEQIKGTLDELELTEE